VQLRIVRDCGIGAAAWRLEVRSCALPLLCCVPGAQVAGVGSCGGAGVQKHASSQEGHDAESPGSESDGQLY
jgi:hypothetical protein